MANAANNLSFSTGMTCRYLSHMYYVRTESIKVNLHEHSFWHIDFMLSGSAECYNGYKSISLKKNNAVLLPPGVKHGFIYPESSYKWLSVRFYLNMPTEELSPLPLSTSPANKPMLQALQKLLPDNAACRAGDRIACECLLAALAATSYTGRSQPYAGNSLLDKIEAHVRNSLGRHIPLNELAMNLCYSVSRLSAIFKEMTGESLKRYLDRKRLGEAERLLAYEELTISEIAEKMQFADIYSFSRFFKRLNGKSPREFRASLAHF